MGLVSASIIIFTPVIFGIFWPLLKFGYRRATGKGKTQLPEASSKLAFKHSLLVILFFMITIFLLCIDIEATRNGQEPKVTNGIFFLISSLLYMVLTSSLLERWTVLNTNKFYKDKN
ncbi:MAG: hypothetical protein AAFZ15_17245 [Bacteroidota bacterium]